MHDRSSLWTPSLVGLLFGLATACSSSSSPVSPPHDGGSSPPLDAGKDSSSHKPDASKHDASKPDASKPDASTTTDAGGSDASDASAGTPGSPPLLGEDCDPMVPTECGFPFPSSVWTTPDTTMPNGVHVAFGATTLPVSSMMVRVGSGAFATRDGFSPGGTILTHLPNATITGLPGLSTMALSVTQSSPTLLIEADTGTLVAHFAELDVSGNDPVHEAFMIHPAARLKDATRYIVAIRNVVDGSGTLLPANPIFAALRDNTPSPDISVGRRRALYADIMGKLTANGVDTSKLQLAWDFTTASEANTTSWLVSMRDQALAVVGATGPSYTITLTEDNPNQWIRRRLTGMMTVPLYLTAATSPANINFGPDGLPKQNGTATFQFLVHIPNSLVTAGKQGPIIENGHGLLGSETEGENGYLAQICDREGYVAVAVNLIGLASDDQNAVIADVSGDLSMFEQQVERQHQGLVNELLAMRMMMGGMATDPNTIFNGVPTIDPTTHFYRGDSQGGILGGTFMSISTDVTRGFLGEPGAPYSLLLNRSADFTQFLLILRLAYPNPLDAEFNIDLIQALWDRTEPDGYLPYLRSNTLPNTPAHDVLLAAALGDHQVTPLGAEFMARSLGALNLEKPNQEIYGLTDSPSGFTGSGFVLWDFGLPLAPVTDIPMTEGNDPHDELPSVFASEDMVDQFLRTGIVNQTCPDGGPCVAVCGDAGMCVAQ
jgi:hypothetical protein